jgi:thioredoxin reductase (NADPH)
METVVIVGSGPAGLTAALYAARANRRPLVLEGPEPGGQLLTTAEVENFPGFPEGIAGPTLMEKLRAQAERFGTRFAPDAVTGADFGARPLRLARGGGETVEALAVIIATGARPRYLGLPSEQTLIGRGVSACATCDGALYRNVPVAVVGGGDTALEEAIFLTRFASQVTVIHRRDQFRASKVMSDRVRAHPKIRIVWDTVVEEVLDAARNEVTGLRLRNVKTGAPSDLAVAALFVAIGHSPNTDPFRGQVAMDAGGYITTQNTRTNVPGVFAAGDVQDPAYRQAVTAAGSGCMAALETERYLERMGH